MVEKNTQQTYLPGNVNHTRAYLKHFFRCTKKRIRTYGRNSVKTTLLVNRATKSVNLLISITDTL